MKDLLKKIDVIYILGLLITLIGFYFKDRVLLTEDVLYPIVNLFTPLIVNIFIFGGILTIIIEMIVTKEIIILYNLLKKLPTITMIISSLYIVLFILAFITSALPSYLLTMVIVIAITIYFAIKNHWLYSIGTLVLVLNLALQLSFIVSSERNIPGEALIMQIFLLIILFMLVKAIYLLAKKKAFISYLISILVIVGLVFVSMTLLENAYNNHYSTLRGYNSFEQNNPLWMLDSCDDGNLYWTSFLLEDYEDNLSFGTYCEDQSFGWMERNDSNTMNLAIIYVTIPLLLYVGTKYGDGIELLPKKIKKEVD